MITIVTIGKVGMHRVRIIRRHHERVLNERGMRLCTPSQPLQARGQQRATGPGGRNTAHFLVIVTDKQ